MSGEGKHLPGFARDQEVFETSDTEEDAGNNYEDDRKSAAVQQLDTKYQTSFDRFRGKALDGKNADFSDRIDRTVQHGFQADPDVYEMVSLPREPETLMQRYHRLRQEVADLLSDMDAVKEAQLSSEKLAGVSPVQLMEDVQLLQKQLHGLQLDRVLGTQLLLAPEHPHQTVLLRDLKAQVEALKATPEQGPTSDQPTYEVYTRTDTAKFSHLSKLSEVEERLARLEAVVGNEETTVSTVAGGLDAEHKDLSSAVLSLQAKVALMDSAHISTIAGQLQGLLGLLEQVETRAKDKTEDPDKQTKLSEALETVSRVSVIAPLVPDLISRLHALRDLHERAAQFSGSVAYMSDSQDQLSKQITSLQALVAKVQESLQTNMSTVQTNVSGLESRLNSLQERH